MKKSQTRLAYDPHLTVLVTGILLCPKPRIVTRTKVIQVFNSNIHSSDQKCFTIQDTYYRGDTYKRGCNKLMQLQDLKEGCLQDGSGYRDEYRCYSSCNENECNSQKDLDHMGPQCYKCEGDECKDPDTKTEKCTAKYQRQCYTVEVLIDYNL